MRATARLAAIVLTLLAALAVPSGAAAAAQAPAPGAAPEELKPAEVQRLFDAYVVVQAQEALRLTDDQYSRLLPKLRALQQIRRESQQARLRLIAELAALTNPKRDPAADESELHTRLSALQELDSRSAADLRRAYDEIDEVLDVRQQARFRVFEEQIERRKLQLLLRARRPTVATRQQ